MENKLKILDEDKLQQSVINLLLKPIKPLCTGFKIMQQNRGFIKGNCTDITGYPYSGKTLFLIEELFNLSEKYGIKHLLHLPDSGKPEEVASLLLNKMTGKNFYHESKYRITEAEILKSWNWINEHFGFLEFEKRPTPFEFWDYAAKSKYDTASIDSWNYMRHDGDGTKYLADVLSYRNEIAEKSNKHFYTIIHPRNPNKDDFKDGKLKAPDVFNLMGGSEWNNNAKNIIVIHKEEKESDVYDVYFRKNKPRQVGKTGLVQLNYDIFKQKFYETIGGERSYAFEYQNKSSFNAHGGFPEKSDIPF